MAKFSKRPSLFLASTPVCWLRFEVIWGWWVFLIDTGEPARRLYGGRWIYFGRKL